MIINVIVIVLAVLYCGINFLTAAMMSTSEMKRKYVEKECMIGLLCTSIFYAPAWILKLLKVVVDRAIR